MGRWDPRLLLLAMWVIAVGCTSSAATSAGSAAPSGPASVLQMRGVRSTVTRDSPAYGQTLVTCGPGDPCTAEELLQAPHIVLVDGSGVKYRLGPVVVTGADVASARAAPPTAQIPTWIVTLRLTAVGRTRFAEVTERLAEVLPPRQIAVIVDGRVVTAPMVESPMTSGSVELDNLTQMEAKSLVARLS